MKASHDFRLRYIKHTNLPGYRMKYQHHVLRVKRLYDIFELALEATVLTNVDTKKKYKAIDLEACGKNF